jgi:hypothetical protein
MLKLKCSVPPLTLRLTLAGSPGGSVFTPSTCAALMVWMLLIRLKSAWSWSRIT